MIEIQTPVTDQMVEKLQVGDMVYISGDIFCGRDAVLPRIVKLAEAKEQSSFGIDLQGSVIFHTAVSPAGVGPTSSNKLEIESSIAPLSASGVKIHLGKGKIQKETVALLQKYNAIYAVIPPVTALLGDKTVKQDLIAFPELGMEAFYRLSVKAYPAIIAAAHGRDIYG